ncbi:MAG: STAS domain-containing protein [Oscillospiraceae bacterium]|nr:STAS domain-containing protein [Oscillospiraceae bacterium]
MTLHPKKEGTKMTIEVEGRIDTKTAPELDAFIKNSLDGIELLVFDFAETVYISSAGLRILLIAEKIMSKQGQMKLIHVSKDLMEIFDITGTSTILTIQ